MTKSTLLTTLALTLALSASGAGEAEGAEPLSRGGYLPASQRVAQRFFSRPYAFGGQCNVPPMSKTGVYYQDENGGFSVSNKRDPLHQRSTNSTTYSANINGQVISYTRQGKLDQFPGDRVIEDMLEFSIKMPWYEKVGRGRLRSYYNLEHASGIWEYNDPADPNNPIDIDPRNAHIELQRLCRYIIEMPDGKLAGVLYIGDNAVTELQKARIKKIKKQGHDIILIEKSKTGQIRQKTIGELTDRIENESVIVDPTNNSSFFETYFVDSDKYKENAKNNQSLYDVMIDDMLNFIREKYPQTTLGRADIKTYIKSCVEGRNPEELYDNEPIDLPLNRSTLRSLLKESEKQPKPVVPLRPKKTKKQKPAQSAPQRQPVKESKPFRFRDNPFVTMVLTFLSTCALGGLAHQYVLGQTTPEQERVTETPEEVTESA
tara:strand:- start:1413 stop:2708 length:1296 start_codon:yes stop_codon:yes gene_type:complete